MILVVALVCIVLALAFACRVLRYACVALVARVALVALVVGLNSGGRQMYNTKCKTVSGPRLKLLEPARNCLKPLEPARKTIRRPTYSAAAIA